MLEYAKLHEIELATLFDIDDGSRFYSGFNSSMPSRASYIIAILESMDDQSRHFAEEHVVKYMDQRYGRNQEQQERKPKWSILWGLFTRW